MAKFSGGKYEDGVLSYVYEAKPGGRKNNINIKNIKGKWFFVDKKGKVRDKLANGGELSKTHVANLKGAPGSSEENIFASANVSSETGKIADPGDNVNTGGWSPSAGSSGSSGSVTGTGDLPGRPLAESNYSLAPVKQGGMQAQSEWADKGLTSEPKFEQSWSPARGSDFRGSSTGDSSFGPGNPSASQSDGTFTTSNFGGGRQMGIGENTAGAFSGQTTTGPGIYEFAPSEMTGPATGDGNLVPPTPVMAVPSDPGTQTWSGMASAGPPGVEIQSTGFGGRPETPIGDNVFNTTQDSTTPGITVDKDSPWGAADWSAVGSVMKGVGGLASAYTGIKNYQLARDAFGAQKDQWQADYNQRLKAYEDNKQLQNQDIQSRNRTLRARNAARTDTYQELA